jgi:hypothetical protein
LQFPKKLGVKKVNVLVSPSNYVLLKAAYTQIPNVTVQPFMLRPKDLNISTILTLMSVSQTEAPPLYMGVVKKILRTMASESGDSFKYPEFRRRLGDAGLDKKQEEFLNQRLDLLESFLDLDGSTASNNFPAGEITIIDLSCPFVDASTACVLFKIGMGLYLESDPNTGKVIVLDEAHKVRAALHLLPLLVITQIIVYDRHARLPGAHGIFDGRDPPTTTLRRSRHHLDTRAKHLAQADRPVLYHHHASILEPGMARRSAAAYIGCG